MSNPIESPDDDDETIRKAFLEAWHEVMTNAPTRSIWDILAEIDDESDYEDSISADTD